MTKVLEKEILVESCFALIKTLCSAVTEENQLAFPLITSIYMLLYSEGKQVLQKNEVSQKTLADRLISMDNFRMMQRIS